MVSPRGFSDLDNAAKKKAKGAVEDTLDALKPPVVTVYMLSVCIAQPRKDRKDDEGNFDHSDRTCSSRIGSFRNNPLKKIHSDYADLGIVKRDRRGQSNDHAINMPALWFTMILFYSVGTGLIFLGWIPLLVTTLGVVIGLEHEESREPSFRDSMYSAWRVFRKLKVILLWVGTAVPEKRWSCAYTRFAQIGFILLLSGVIISTIVLLTLENRINHSKVPAESKRGRAFLPLTWTAVGTACVSLCWISYLRLVHLDREEFEEVFGTD